MSQAINELLSILDLETLEINIFRGVTPAGGWGRVFGGQVIAQALVAATRTVEGKSPHSLHAYFILGGDPSIPIIYEVERIRDGRSFATRRVVAIQRGQAIFSLSASFQIDEPGLTHSFAMPDVPDPESLPSEADVKAQYAHLVPENARRYFERQRPIEIRPVTLARFLDRSKVLPPHEKLWVRAVAPLPDDPAIHRAVLAYLSDMTLLDTALRAHGKSIFDKQMQMASLDHAMWFHRPFRADEWMLYVQDSPNANGARGLTRGTIFSRDGTLIASVAQEGLMRERT
ncbi:MAG: acyl-CoA thioesterase II [Hyphomicrobiales bacterium]|nr:acyl-CoA thioesterase II [Hyphomicrobiales bacterium]MDE2113368.1 acyl-CoA thioesterase II [Hyphomicrobiales bacterium]